VTRSAGIEGSGVSASVPSQVDPAQRRDDDDAVRLVGEAFDEPPLRDELALEGLEPRLQLLLGQRYPERFELDGRDFVGNNGHAPILSSMRFLVALAGE